MSLPTPYTVLLERFVDGVEDAHGNVSSGWADPVPVAVHGWATPGSDQEPFEAGRNTVLRDLDVYAPGGTVVAPRDHIAVDGVLFEVVGYVEDYTKGPWQWNAGVRINLKRIEG